MRLRRLGRRGASFVDTLLVLAALSVLAALAYPAWSARGFRRQVEEAAADVEAVSARARSTFEVLGRWPTASAPGQEPPELTGLVFTRESYALQWTTWEVVDSVLASRLDVGPAAPGDAPDPAAQPGLEPVRRVVGAVAVHSRDGALLAELLRRYGADESFVLDSSWTRVLPDRADPPPDDR